MRNFNDYHQAYLKNYPVSNTHSFFLDSERRKIVSLSNSINFFYKIYKKLLFFILSIISSYKTWILLTPIIFTFSLNLVLFKDNSFFISEPNKEIITTSLNNYETFSSSSINKIYSEKIIIEPVASISKKPQTKSFESVKKLDNKLIKFKKNTISSNTDLALTSVSWKDNYSSKKINFIQKLLPIIAFENQKILIDRNRLIELKKYIIINKTLKAEDISYLKIISKKYLIDTSNKHKIDLIEELLVSVNIIPNSIVLAQAANESGWGSSRFATEYNALFGEYTYDENQGIIPNEREIGKKHLIRNFSSIDKSVQSYFKNINTHYAYQKFRDLRHQAHINDSNQIIKILTQALDVYAEDKSYVKTINSIIDTNKLIKFDKINMSLFTDS